MHNAISLVTAALYAAASMVLARRLASGESRRLNVLVGSLAACAVVAHALVVFPGALGAPRPALGVFEAASLFAWSAAVALLLAALVRPLADLGMLILPVAAITVLLNLLWPAPQTEPATMDLGTRVHVVLSVGAYAVLSVSACQAVALAIHERHLTRRRPSGVARFLPPLQVQEALLFQSLGLGFFLLSLSLVSGVMFVDDLLAQHLAHKTALSLITWLVFAVLLWGRWRHGWRGRTATRWTLAGFALLAIAYFGSKVILELVLGQHWSPQ